MTEQQNEWRFKNPDGLFRCENGSLQVEQDSYAEEWDFNESAKDYDVEVIITRKPGPVAEPGYYKSSAYQPAWGSENAPLELLYYISEDGRAAYWHPRGYWQNFQTNSIVGRAVRGNLTKVER